MTNQSATAADRRRSGYRTLLGYRTKVWREGYGEVEMTTGPQHMNSINIVHGGVYASLLDAALGHAVAYCAVPGNARFSTTMSLTTTFLRAAKPGRLVGIGRIEAIEGRVVTATVEVRDDTGALCAVGQGSFLYFPGSEHPEGVPKR